MILCLKEVNEKARALANKLVISLGYAAHQCFTEGTQEGRLPSTVGPPIEDGTTSQQRTILNPFPIAVVHFNLREKDSLSTEDRVFVLEVLL